MIQQIITQQLQINAGQLEIMAQQLELLRSWTNGDGYAAQVAENVAFVAPTQTQAAIEQAPTAPSYMPETTGPAGWQRDAASV